MIDKDTNPRGFKRPHSGIGGGVGRPDGLRDGRNTEPCDTGGPGQGEGKGRNKGGRKK